MNGYCMVQITVHNADEYAKYAKLAGPAVEKFGGEFLARAGKCLTKEGPVQLRNVIIKFPTKLTKLLLVFIIPNVISQLNMA